MPDKDLRKQALKGGKTTSRKAIGKSLQSSPAHSRPASAIGSRSASRVVSRDVSDDEDEKASNLSDDTNLSVNSIDPSLENDELNEPMDVVRKGLLETIDEIIERKGSSIQSREDALAWYARALMAHHFESVITERVDDILSAFGKSIKTEASSKETVLALRAVALTALSCKDETIYEKMSSRLKRTVSDSQDNLSKAAAIETLGICLIFGGADAGEIDEICTFLLEIIQSDGSFVGADDDAKVVTAAINTYALLVTELEDVASESEDAIEALLEQLDSSDTNVQIAAGELIALLFEKSYGSRDDSDEEEEEEAEEDDSEYNAKADKTMVKRYDAYHNTGEVLAKVSGLASLSSRAISKHDKRKLHQFFGSVALTVEDPRVGLLTNTGSRPVVRCHKETQIRVDKWWKRVRLNALRRVLLGGFINHYFEGNPQVINAVPMLLRDANGGAISPRRFAKRSGDKYRDVRRFIGAEA